jgi:WD40-like Beta Propeller Repeat
MPDIQEVFRVATQKVRPEPGALDRQHARERGRAIRRKVTVYALVAALVIAGVVIAAARLPGTGSTPAGKPKGTGSAPVSGETAEVVGLDGTIRALVPGLPVGCCQSLSLAADGTQIALIDGGEIATIGLDGTGLRTIPLSMTVGNPVWSPDGTRIAFEGTSSFANQDIYVMDADGSNVHRLTRSPYQDAWPSWSPDGSTILYANYGPTPIDPNGNSPTEEIYSVPAAGGTPARLTHNQKDDGQAAYSPDGTQIAYHRNGGLWIMDADGSNAHEVPLPASFGRWGKGYTPHWSPDGTKIAFTRFDPAWRYNNLPVVRVYVLDVASGDVSPVGKVEMASIVNAPQWLPSGDALLVYRAERP